MPSHQLTGPDGSDLEAIPARGDEGTATSATGAAVRRAPAPARTGPADGATAAVGGLDPLGGGDAFCSAIAVELARGTPVEGALQVGRAAAAVAVTTPGAAAAMPHREAVAAVLRREA